MPDGVEISCVIMTHPRRLARAQSLASGHPGLSARGVVDPDPEGPRSPLRTARLAWGAIAPGATHHLVLQDDVHLCDGFLEQVRAAVATRPQQALCLYTKWSSRTSHLLRLAALAGCSWAPIADRYVPSVALVLPAGVAAGLAEFLRSGCTLDEPDDDAIGRYLRSCQIQSYVSVPNLADHVPMESLVGNDTFGDRPSACFRQLAPPPGHWTAEAAAFTFIPYASRTTPGGEVECLASCQDELSWARVPVSDVLARHGRDESQIRELFTCALGSVPGADHIKSVIGKRLLYQLWLVASLLGMSLADDPQRQFRESLATALSRPDARQAMLTLPGGVLRGYVPAEILRRHGPSLVSLSARALTESCQYGRQHTR